MTSVTLICKECEYTARRQLMNVSGCRGVHETTSESALCPNGHGVMIREDGVPQERWARWSRVKKET